MQPATAPFAPAALLLLSALAPARAHESRTSPVPPHMEDLKTPAPPPKAGAAPEPDELPTAPVALPFKSTAREVGRGFLAGLGPARVHYDEPGDGRIWAVGDAFKASFGTEGATYVPYFGSAAPRNFPVRFELRSLTAGGLPIAFDAAAAPRRIGDRVVFDRGIVDEVYDLTPTSIEQSFVLEEPLAGEIALEIAVESELERTSDADGLVLAGEPGSVRYGRAFAVDALAGRSELSTAWLGDGIRIVVPAARAAAAAWPLVVDPVITTFDVDDDSTLDDGVPDVAYDATTARWMVVYERVFSATDHDVYHRLYTATGGGVSLGYLDSTTSYWADPRVANNNQDDRFLCVAAVGSPTGGARIVRGRTRDANGSGLGAQFTISSSEAGDKHHPDVGGDPAPLASSYFCVVWQRDLSSSDHDVHARLVTPDSTMFGSVIFLSNSSGSLDQYPSISSSNGPLPSALQRWNVVWSRLVGFADNDLWGAQLAWNGGIVSPPFVIDPSSASTGAASVSSPTADSERNYLVACMRQTSAFGDNNIQGYVLSGSSLIDSASLTSLSGAPTAENQYYPSVDCDGRLFVVAEQETFNGSSGDYDVYVSTFQLVGDQLTLAEGHQNLAFSTTVEHVVEVACAGSVGGPPRTTMAVWEDAGDIEAGVYAASPFAAFCRPGTDGVIACPCGNAPSGANRGCNNSAATGGASIAASGNVAPDTVVLSATAMLPTALCIFTQGDALIANGTSFGDGVRCAGGQLLRLAVKSASAGSATYPQGPDASISQRSADLGAPIPAGARRFYYAYYRDPGAAGCTATFNSTNSLQIQW